MFSIIRLSEKSTNLSEKNYRYKIFCKINKKDSNYTVNRSKKSTFIYFYDFFAVNLAIYIKICNIFTIFVVPKLGATQKGVTKTPKLKGRTKNNY